MKVEKSLDKTFGVVSYYIKENNHVIAIDPTSCFETKKRVDSDQFDFAILTHEHYDHIKGVNSIQKEFGVPVFCGKNAQRGLSNPIVNLSKYVDYLRMYLPFGKGSVSPCNYVCRADRELNNGEIIMWENHAILFKEIPGHSVGSIAILVDCLYLFSGDTIFKNYPTATRLPGGSTKDFQSITEPWLDSLPQDIMVYPGHTKPFRLSERYN